MQYAASLQPAMGAHPQGFSTGAAPAPGWSAGIPLGAAGNAVGMHGLVPMAGQGQAGSVAGAPQIGVGQFDDASTRVGSSGGGRSSQQAKKRKKKNTRNQKNTETKRQAQKQRQQQ